MSLIPDVAFAENTSQRLPCVIVLDGSTSMCGEPIVALNAGLKTLADDLKSDSTARQRVRLLVLRIGEPDVQVVTDWTDAIDFEPPTIVANGATPLGAGVRRALLEIEEQKRQFDDNGIPFNRPWLFIMTDGEPTDPDWEDAAAECCAAEAAGKLTAFCIGVGRGANLGQLARFSSRSPKLLEAAHFKEFFLWLSRSAKVGSQKATSEPTQMAATDDWAVVPAKH
ncbi:MAG TPA: hypothetical protein VEZ12_10475 [Herpetosiphonaceae bacterium]|nr:hypothetical protein [Herpetosiphonaceae bacterium]